MPPRKRATLDALAGRIASKSGVPPPPPPAPDPPAEQPPARQKAILFRTTPDDWKALKNIATERETTLRAVVQEAIDAYLQSRRRAPRA